MKVEVLTPFLHQGLRYAAGEVREVDDSTGEYFCRAGWAKDVNGVVATGNPDKTDTVLMVDSVKKQATVENING